MSEKIHVASPEPADLDAIPADIAAATMLYQLPPGWRWIGDAPEPQYVPGGFVETGSENPV